MLKQDIINQLDSVIADIKKKYNDISPILPGIAALIRNAIVDNFDSGGRWDGIGTTILSGGNKRWHPNISNFKAILQLK